MKKEKCKDDEHDWGEWKDVCLNPIGIQIANYEKFRVCKKCREIQDHPLREPETQI